MKRKYSMLIGLLVLLVVGGIVVHFLGNKEVSDPQSNEPSRETSLQIKDNKRHDPAEILSNTDPLNTMPEYIEEGEKCYEVDDVVKRGDCFIDVHSSYFLWTFDTSKETFYYSFHHDQSHWKEVFYFEVDEDDALSEVIHTEEYEAYEDVHVSSHHKESEDERGIKTINDYWYVFSSIIPQEDREMLTNISWFDTGEDFVLAVGVAEEDVTKSALLISENMPKYGSPLKSSFIHEYGHMFTLDDSQVQIDEDLIDSDIEDEWEKAEEECSTLFVNWGCLQEDSYLYAFYEEFWEDVSNDYEAIDWEDESTYEQFFFNHEERFYNSYQGTSPVEDIAETFTFFIMQPSKVADDAEEIKDGKIAFLYEYDELTHLRTAILENLFELNKKDGQFY